MKKYFVFLAAAAALVACSKSELVPVTTETETEISYTVAPKVRSTVNDFNQDWKFMSVAYYLANKDASKTDQTWAKHTDTPTEYINAEISYNSGDNVWRNATKKYYWPKDGKLTFFAYTNVTESLEDDKSGTGKGTSKYTQGAYIKPAVTVKNGVVYEKYDVVTNKNVDILVADISVDNTKNLDTDYSTNYTDSRKNKFTGVPTLFRHKLSKVIFTAQTVNEKGDEYDYKTTDGITFTLNSIKFTSIDKVNTYTQTAEADALGSWSTTDSDITEGNQTYYDKGTGTGVDITKTIVGLYAGGNQYYYLPQNFEAQTAGSADKDYFTVNYTIKYANGTEETIDQVCIMNNSDTAKSVFNKWEMAKVYYINLKFSLNEILWDPAVEDWTEETKPVTIG